MKKICDNDKLDFIVPISIEGDWPDGDELVREILFLKENYGFDRFLLCGPGGGWRATEMPPKSHYEKLAEFFVQIRDEVARCGVTCGWWNGLTLKSGASKKYQRMVRKDGNEAPFANCPLDPAYQKAFAERNALFCKIAKPAFVLFEDDYAIGAATGSYGCFCKFHLDEFAKREGKYYTREELVGIFDKRTPDSFELMKRWRDLRADSMVSISEAVRKEVDIETPEIPFGLCQSGSCDMDGDSTEKICRALAGSSHTPFARFHGTTYCDLEGAKGMPRVLYHAIYCKEHIKGDFAFYHESDIFPHTRFYMPVAKMRAMESVMFSNAFDGALFYNSQLLDDHLEEQEYGKMLAKERKRFNVINKLSKQCKRQGVEIAYDPFWNTAEDLPDVPYWTESVAIFGIPYITTEASVAFWDSRQAKYYDHDTVMKYLSKGLFLDGEAAKILCERGYGKYLGVEIGEDIAQGRQQYDLDAKEVIKAPFDEYSKGKHMPVAYFFSPRGTGKGLEIKVINPKVEVVTENYNCKKEFIGNAMVRFENELGGRIVVMGMTMLKNRSHSLFNYRRQKLFHELLKWCDDSYVFAKNQPNIYTTVNKAENPDISGFMGILTLINLGEDEVGNVTLHLPADWQSANEFKILDKSGEWIPGNIEKKDNELAINEVFKYCDPMYVLIK